jgi:hypothetical protein
LPDEPVKLMRSPKETECCNHECNAPISFGAYAYVNSDTEEALCLECGVKRGLSSKDRAKQVVEYLELRELIKALKDEAKVQGNGLVLLKEQVDIYRLGERDLDLEKSVLALAKMAEDFMRQSIGTSEETEALRKLLESIAEDQELRAEIRAQVERRLFWLKTAEKKVKKKHAILQEETA